MLMSFSQLKSLPAHLVHVLAAALCLAVLSFTMGTAAAQTSALEGGSNNAAEGNPAGGPVRLRQPAQQVNEDRLPSASGGVPAIVAPAPYLPGEFERFVQRQAGTEAEVRRLGADLIAGTFDSRGAELSPLVPQDYIVAPGDEVLLTLWGTLDADLRLVVDRSGRISIPRVGSVQVSGVRNSELQEVVSRRVAQVFKNFQLSVSLGQLRGIRVFVTGFVMKPGTYTVSSLSTVVAALMRAGGPASAGSFRSVELRRGSRLVSSFDLYDLLLRGDRSADQIVQAGDVVHVNTVGVQVGFVGSVNKPTVIEMKSGETIADALRFAGGFSAVADRTRLAVERLQERFALRVQQLELPRDLNQTLSHGDVLRAFSAVDIALPTQRQSKRVRVEGEVQRPAEYVLPEGSSIKDALRAAGGFTQAGYVFATEFTRRSVQQTQQENYDRALRDMETDFARASSSVRVSSAEDGAALTARNAGAARLIDRLRALRPTGRVVLQLRPGSTELPDLALEDGDRVYIPARPTTVGIFGSVFNAASYLYLPGRTLDEYIKLAGGPTKGADESSIFLVRADGSVASRRQSSGWFKASDDLGALVAEPGDSVFVPEEMDKTTFLQAAKDWTQILYQFGIGAAGIKSAVR
jgi:protein involved in polysaccharide export with SLBB domain